MEEAAPVRPRRRIALATSIALASCKQVYDLGDTDLVPPADTNRDDGGVEDVLDVCPDDPDPAQRDDDADGLGDVSDEPGGTSALVRLTSATATVQQVIGRTPSRLLAYALYRSQSDACAPTLYR